MSQSTLDEAKERIRAEHRAIDTKVAAFSIGFIILICGIITVAFVTRERRADPLAQRFTIEGSSPVRLIRDTKTGREYIMVNGNGVCEITEKP